MKRANLALIGCGYWGKNHLRVLSEMGGVEISYVCDSSEDVKIKTTGEVVFTRDYEAVLRNSRVDGVVIATPTSTHYEIARKALRVGKSVFVEKPLATSVKHAKRLCELAEEVKKPLMVGEIFRYHAAVLFLQDFIARGEIGRLRYIDSRRVGLGPVRSDISVLWDLATHDIYISNLITGRSPESASYHGVSHNGRFDDIACLNLNYGGGVLSTILVNWEHPVKERRLVVGGTKKAVLFNDIEPSEKIRIYERGIDYQPTTGGFGEFQAATRDGSIIIPNIKLWQPLEKEIEEFVGLIKTNGAGNCRQGLETVRVLEAAEESRRCGGREVQIVL